MRTLALGAPLLLLLLAQVSLAEPTATVTIIERPSFTTTLGNGPETNTPGTDKPTTSHSTLTTPKVQASSSQAGHSSGASGSPNAVNGVDAEGGASGSDTSSYSLSTAGLIAVIVVVVAVVIFGIASIVLYIVAKRRNWKIRESLKRASRRLTGRRDTRSEADRRKRSGVIATPRKAGTTVAHPPGHKRGLAVEVVDVEKGTSGASEKKDGWAQRLWDNDWK